MLDAATEEAVAEGLELAAGIRIKPSIAQPTTVSRWDVAATRKVILLFLENLDADLTVSDLREALDEEKL